MPRGLPIHIAVAATLCSTLVGCASQARITVHDPRQAPPLDALRLAGKWAFFDASPDTERFLLAFAHPGAIDGTRQYFLYLRVPPGKGTKAFGTPTAQPATRTEPRAPTRAADIRGFFLQRTGPMSGLTELASGQLRLGGIPFDGGNMRTGILELRCADGTRITGRFTARRNHLEVRAFEQDLYPADVQALLRVAPTEDEATTGESQS